MSSLDFVIKFGWVCVLGQVKLPAAEIAATLDEFRLRHLSELREVRDAIGRLGEDDWLVGCMVVVQYVRMGRGLWVQSSIETFDTIMKR